LNLEEFREQVYSRFGRHLERANEETLRPFLDQMQAVLYPPKRDGETVVVEGEVELDYHRLVRRFLADSLRREDEQNLIALWLFCAELWLYVLTEDVSRQFAAFLREIHWESEE